MEPLRIYVDASVLDGCFDPEFASWSNGLMRDFRAGRLVPVLSDVTAAEVGQHRNRFENCTRKMVALVGTVLPVTPEVLGLVNAKRERGRVLWFKSDRGFGRITRRHATKL